MVLVNFSLPAFTTTCGVKERLAFFVKIFLKLRRYCGTHCSIVSVTQYYLTIAKLHENLIDFVVYII